MFVGWYCYLAGFYCGCLGMSFYDRNSLIETPSTAVLCCARNFVTIYIPFYMYLSVVVVRRPSCIIRCPSFVVRHPSLVVRRPLSVVVARPSVICRRPSNPILYSWRLQCYRNWGGWSSKILCSSGCQRLRRICISSFFFYEQRMRNSVAEVKRGEKRTGLGKLDKIDDFPQFTH